MLLPDKLDIRYHIIIENADVMDVKLVVSDVDNVIVDKKVIILSIHSIGILHISISLKYHTM